MGRGGLREGSSGCNGEGGNPPKGSWGPTFGGSQLFLFEKILCFSWWACLSSMVYFGAFSPLRAVRAISMSRAKNSLPIVPRQFLSLSWDLPGLGGGVSGPKPQKSEKSLEKSPRTLGPQKSEKSLGESPKSLEKPVLGLFRDFSDSPRDFFQTFGARGCEDFFETFFRLLGFRPGDCSSQAGEIPIPVLPSLKLSLKLSVKLSLKGV